MHWVGCVREYNVTIFTGGVYSSSSLGAYYHWGTNAAVPCMLLMYVYECTASHNNCPICGQVSYLLNMPTELNRPMLVNIPSLKGI